MKILRILIIAALSLTLPLQMSSQNRDIIVTPDWLDSSDISILSELDKLKDLAPLSDLANLADLDIYKDVNNLLKSENGKQVIVVQSNKSDKERTPNRIEEKSFDNVSKVNIYQNGGNVTIKESNSRKINVTIQYFDIKMQKAEANVFMKNGELNIETSESSREMGYYINYIISLPKGIPVDAKLNYANISIDKAQALYNLRLSYGNASIANSDKDTPKVTIKYGSLKMDNAKDVSVDAMYSKISIKNSNTLNLNGKYNSLSLGKVNTIHFDKQSMYNKYQIESINNLTASIKYDKIEIGELVQNIDLKAAYSKINIGKVSSKSKNITVNGSYSTVSLSFDESISASVEANIKYGDLFVSKKYNTKTISDESDSFSVSKKVLIGNSSPSLSVKVSNSYSNVNIK
ncbi:DUF4097 family beta strand repeat-containing protein [Dysgonomonas massiliensis]|uniref:DUF4097 family beta strand repeat-containing protein n=1 Tax=Dysgonomonas massiliensis TaxID=2040292 RepID=UPI0011AF7491|nr:DUF4097 family beta strand repeat-containing protein [Dysgonomonas massiliensis]